MLADLLCIYIKKRETSKFLLLFLIISALLIKSINTPPRSKNHTPLLLPDSHQHITDYLVRAVFGQSVS